MRLEDLIKNLEALDPDKKVKHGFGSPHSDRGDYCNLAFKPLEETTVGEMLKHAKSALGKIFEGYKGGHFLMDTYTKCHIGEWGRCGEEITGADFRNWMREDDEDDVLLKLKGEVVELNQRLIERTEAGLAKTSELQRELQQKDAQIAALRGALSFYADTSKYPSPLTGGMGDLWQDCGQIATKALSSPPPPVVPASDAHHVADALEVLITHIQRIDPISSGPLAQTCQSTLNEFTKRNGNGSEFRAKHPQQDPDLGPLSEGHVCKHNIRWPHECKACANAAWEADLVKHQQEKEGA